MNHQLPFFDPFTSAAPEVEGLVELSRKSRMLPTTEIRIFSEHIPLGKQLSSIFNQNLQKFDPSIHSAGSHNSAVVSS